MKYRQLVSMPSSVSTWLNEQLEARGIDSEVYTRYILSLLHANTLDILHPEEEDYLETRKDGRRNAVSQRRFRRASVASTLWWRHARYGADDQIKRSAAVKCLKSAADQNCEIESLVNELCDKLKEIEAPSISDQPEEPEKSKQISRKELAEKYYAAFPALCADSEQIKLSKFDNSAWLSPQKQAASPQKKLSHLNTSQKKKHPPKNKNKMDSFRANNKSFHSNRAPYRTYSKEQKEQIRKLEKEMMDNFNNWQFLNNFSLEDRDHCLDSSDPTLPDVQEDIDMYDSLPVNLSNLLDDSNDSHVDMMNSVNIRQTGKQHNFIPCGTNIVSSIWSNEDNSGLKSDFEFGSISSLDGNQNDSWPDFNKQNENNNFLEQNSTNSNSVFAGFRSLPSEDVKSDFSSIFLTESNECLFDMITISLMKINHNKEKSGFSPVVPRPQTFSKLFNPFGNYTNPAIAIKDATDGPKNDHEDLLTSEKSHFKPIKATEKAGQYQDGASFVINGNLDKVEYKRSPSGSMYLEQEFGQSKKYREYRCTAEPELGTTPSDSTTQKGGTTLESTFVPKFCMDQNDVGCQTDRPPLSKTAKCADLSNLIDYEFEEGEMSNCSCEMECDCNLDDTGLNKDKRFRRRRDSIIEEVSWPYEAKSCDKCNNNNDTTWNMDWLNGTGQDSWKNMENAKNIWNGGEVCQACLRLNGGRTPQTDQHTKLKEDIFQDGEQLLSDISSLQKSYMEMSMPIEFVALEPLSDKRKRRHSYIDNATDDAWGFATRFQDDCIFKMWTLPTLRSVTL